MCRFAVPIPNLLTHSTSTIKVQAPKGNNHGSGTRWQTFPHQAHIIGYFNKVQFKDQVVSELKEKLGPGVFIRDEYYRELLGDKDYQTRWAEEAPPHPGQLTPIKGLRTTEGLICALCPERRTAACVLGPSLQRHRQVSHPGIRSADGLTREVVGPIQSFGSNNLLRYFPCPGTSAGQETTLPLPKSEEENSLDDFTAMIRKDKSDLLGFDLDDNKLDKDVLDDRTLMPFFRNSGVHNFLKNVDQKDMVQVLSIRNLEGTRAPLSLRRLSSIVTETFFADCDLAAGMNPTVRRLLRRSNLRSKFAPKYFQVLALRSSKGAYALFEFRLLACCLECVQRERETSPMRFNNVQRKVLEQLNASLVTKPYNKANAVTAMYAAFYALYHPSDSTALVEDVFASPWVAYLAFTFLHPEGGYHSIWMVPTFLSKANYSARLRAARYLKQTLDKHCAQPDFDLESGEGDSWFDIIAVPFAEKFLTEDNLSPFAILQHWMHESTRFCLGHVRPCNISWSENTLMISNYKLNIDQFKQFVLEELRLLEESVSRDVLLGIVPEDVGISCALTDSMDNGDKVTPGYGPFNSPEDKTLDNEDSAKFERALGTLGDRSFVRIVDGRVEYDLEKSTAWMASVHASLQHAYGLMHTLAGLAGRGTEESLIQHTNEELGAARNVEIAKGTIQLNMAYHKNAIETGLFKFIIRILPYRLARIFFILLRVTRPVELGALLRLFIKGSDAKQLSRKIVQLYRIRVFVSWGRAWDADDLSSILKKWFKDGLGIPMGLRMYRHVATAIARIYLRYHLVDDTETLQAAADAQAGRNQKTSHINYAVEKKPNRTKRVQDMELISVHWDGFFGVETYPSPEEEVGKRSDNKIGRERCKTKMEE